MKKYIQIYMALLRWFKQFCDSSCGQKSDRLCRQKGIIHRYYGISNITSQTSNRHVMYGRPTTQQYSVATICKQGNRHSRLECIRWT